MYSKLLVPLDGSKLAETVLPRVPELIKGFGIKDIALVSVTEKLGGRLPRKHVYEDFVPEKPAYDAPLKVEMTQMAVFYWNRVATPQDIPATIGKMEKTAADYLVKVAGGLGELECNITINVLIGNPAEEIVRFAEAQRADLILMASRGKSGFSQWNMGNIADKVIRATQATVILVKPQADFKETRPKRRGVAF
jgi:nucleotide-binding universal stress UspA family protein